jgi:hypothetical protein
MRYRHARLTGQALALCSAARRSWRCLCAQRAGAIAPFVHELSSANSMTAAGEIGIYCRRSHVGRTEAVAR